MGELLRRVGARGERYADQARGGIEDLQDRPGGSPKAF